MCFYENRRSYIPTTLFLKGTMKMDREEIYEMVFQEMMETAVRERNEHLTFTVLARKSMR